jgi:hypothetical protein
LFFNKSELNVFITVSRYVLQIKDNADPTRGYKLDKNGKANRLSTGRPMTVAVADQIETSGVSGLAQVKI